MTTSSSPREEFAGLIAQLVLTRLLAQRDTRTSRTELQAEASDADRPFVRRSIDALVAHGLLFEEKGQIGFTGEGREFLAYRQWVDDGPDGRPVPDEHATAARLRDALDADPRLAPPRALEGMRTLPGRLEEYRRTRRGHRIGRWTAVLALGAVAAAVFVLH